MKLKVSVPEPKPRVIKLFPTLYFEEYRRSSVIKEVQVVGLCQKNKILHHIPTSFQKTINDFRKDEIMRVWILNQAKTHW